MMLMEVQWQVFISLFCYFNSFLQLHDSAAQFSSLGNLSALEWKNYVRIIWTIFCFDLAVATLSVTLEFLLLVTMFKISLYGRMRVAQFSILQEFIAQGHQKLYNQFEILAPYIAFLIATRVMYFTAQKWSFPWRISSFFVQRLFPMLTVESTFLLCLCHIIFLCIYSSMIFQ